MSDLFGIQWVPRVSPRPATCVVGFGSASIRLARRMIQNSDNDLAALRGVAGDELIAALGDADLLPWADGVTYLSRAADAPSLLIPTTSDPSIQLALFERLIVRRFPAVASPVAIVPQTMRIFSLTEARTVTRAILQAWLEVYA